MVTFSDYAGDYLKGGDLQGREWSVTIDRIAEEDVGDSNKLVMHFAGRRKSLPLNKGHIAVLQQAFGDNPSNCRGASVVLYPENTRTPSGAAAIGVRIRLPAVTQQQPPQPQRAPQAAPPPVSPVPLDVAEFGDDDEIPF